MNRIIKDKEKLEQFINWLPALGRDSQFYFALFARKKYDTTGLLKADRSQLKRGMSNKEMLMQKIEELDRQYYSKGKPIPDDTLALYIHPNPRSFKKANIKLLKDIADNIAKDNWQNPKSMALNALQTAKAKSVYIDFDVDSKDVDLSVLDKIVPSAYDVVETRGGYHILVRPFVAGQGYGPDNQPRNKTWYNDIMKAFGKDIDQKGDLLLPVPGCVQGNFTPKFIKCNT